MAGTAVVQVRNEPRPVEKAVNHETAAVMPTVGSDRWWRVTHRPNQRKEPIRVELMESLVPGRKKLSRVIGWDNCVASPKAVSECADGILTRVGAYLMVVGEYGCETP